MKKGKPQPLEEGLILAMDAIDKQISRQMQRNPDELEEQGVQKWEPIEERIEIVSSMLMNRFNDGVQELDSLIVLAQAFVKALALLTEDLDEEGLGKLRSAYVAKAMELISRDATQTLSILRGTPEYT